MTAEKLAEIKSRPDYEAIWRETQAWHDMWHEAKHGTPEERYFPHAWADMEAHDPAAFCHALQVTLKQREA